MLTDGVEVTREEAQELCRQYRSQRSGLRRNRQMASICLICGSIHVVAVDGSEPPALQCRNCGFTFIRYACPACGETVDGRDPANPPCRDCGWRVCTCGRCGPADCPGPTRRRDTGAER